VERKSGFVRLATTSRPDADRPSANGTGGLGVPGRRGDRDRSLLPAPRKRSVRPLRARRLCVGGRYRPRGEAQPPRGRSACVAALRARPALPGGRRRRLHGVRDGAEPRAADPIGRRRVLSWRLSAARHRRIPDRAQAGGTGEPRRRSRLRDRLRRRRARAVGVLHRPLQPHPVRVGVGAARRHGLSGRGCAPPRRRRPAPRRGRGTVERLPVAPRQHRALGRRRRDLRPERRCLCERQLARRVLAPLLRHLGSGRPRSVGGDARHARSETAAAADADAHGAARRCGSHRTRLRSSSSGRSAIAYTRS
jgi:hypothetical protein